MALQSGSSIRVGATQPMLAGIGGLGIITYRVLAPQPAAQADNPAYFQAICGMGVRKVEETGS